MMSIRPHLNDAGALGERILEWLRRRRTVTGGFQQDGIGWIRQPDRLIRVDFAKDAIHLNRSDNEEAQEFATIPRTPGDVLADAALPSEKLPGETLNIVASLVAALGEVPRFSRDVRLVLSGEPILRTSVRLPAASSRRLGEALRYELPRLSPLGADRLYYDFVAARPADGERISEVALRLVKRSAVDQAVAICHAAGLKIAAIAFGDDRRDADWRRFPVDRPALARTLWRRWGVAALTAAALVLTLLLVAALYGRGSAQLDDISGRVAVVRQHAAVVAQLQSDLATLAAEGRFLSEEKQGPMLVGVLAEVTEVLPDGTWLTEFQIKDGKVRIQGYSPNASSLIALIDKSPVFANAQFEAPVVQGQNGDQGGNTERFDISFTLRPMR